MKNTNKINRAKQFMPFASLKGYFDLILEKEKVIEPKKELTDEKKEKISNIILSIKKRDFVKVKFYQNKGYIIKEGIITYINLDMKILKLLKQEIEFEDIYDLEILPK